MEPIIQFYNSLPDQTKKEEYIRSLLIATDYFEKQYVIINSQERAQETKNLSPRSK